MEQLQSLSLARKLILGGGILLLIDTFLNWQQISVSFGGTEVASGGQSAWHGFWGVLLGLMTVALVAWVIARTFGVDMPAGIPEGTISLVLGILILVFAVLKVLVDDFVHWPAYVGILLAAVVTYGAWRNFQESGETLPSMPRAATAGAPPAAPAPAAPAPPAEPAAPAPAEPAPPAATEEPPS